MIHFSCACGEKFEVSDDRAGDDMQCPACKRLLSVPRLGEIDWLADDGTLKLVEAESPKSDLESKFLAFSHSNDMRNDVEEFLLVGEGGEKPDQPPRRIAPRYDPETGELVTDIPIKEAPHAAPPPQDVPLATPTLNYSSGNSPNATSEIRWYHMPWHLLTGRSLMAMLFVFLTHVLIHVGLMLPGFSILLVPFLLVVALSIIAHYCNVMEEFGPHHADDVPVLLRNVSFSEDVLRPLSSILVAAAFSFGPATLLQLFGLGPGSNYPEAWWTAMALGTFVFPAALFTVACSGALQNMLPHRALSVIVVEPFRYLLVVLVLLAGCTAYGLALSRLTIVQPIVLTTAAPLPVGRFLISTGGIYLLFATSVYLMHLAAAWMGFIYRTHHPKLNWVLQQHEQTDRTDTNARLAEMRRRGDPRVRPTARRAPAAQTSSPLPVEPAQGPRSSK